MSTNNSSSIHIRNISAADSDQSFFLGKIYSVSGFNEKSKLASILITDEGLSGIPSGLGGKMKVEFNGSWGQEAIKRLAVGTITRFSRSGGKLAPIGVKQAGTDALMPKMTFKKVKGAIITDGPAPELFVFDSKFQPCARLIVMH